MCVCVYVSVSMFVCVREFHVFGSQKKSCLVNAKRQLMFLYDGGGTWAREVSGRVRSTVPPVSISIPALCCVYVSYCLHNVNVLLNSFLLFLLHAELISGRA